MAGKNLTPNETLAAWLLSMLLTGLACGLLWGWRMGLAVPFLLIALLILVGLVADRADARHPKG